MFPVNLLHLQDFLQTADGLLWTQRHQNLELQPQFLSKPTYTTARQRPASAPSGPSAPTPGKDRLQEGPQQWLPYFSSLQWSAVAGRILHLRRKVSAQGQLQAPDP